MWVVKVQPLRSLPCPPGQGYAQPYIYTIILLKSVAVRKLQVAILARSSRKMSQTVRID